VLIIRRSKLYCTVSGIIKPVGDRPVHRLKEDSIYPAGFVIPDGCITLIQFYLGVLLLMYLLCITHFDVSLTVHLSIIFVIDQLNAQSARSTKHKNYTYEFIYVVASKSSRNHFIYEKYKMVESFKLHFHQNTSVVQLYLPTTVKMLQRFLEAIL